MNIDAICDLVPEFSLFFIQRYEVLEYINRNPRIGRRTLSEKLNFSERMVREIVEILREKKLIIVTSIGMESTSKGKLLLEDLRALYIELNKFNELALDVARILGIKKAIITKGDSSSDSYAMGSLGIEAANLILNSIQPGNYIGITGGRTMYSVAQEMKSNHKTMDLTLLPARGGLGGAAEFQANMIVAKLAEKLNADYKLLTLPDTIEKTALEMLLKNKEVSEVYQAMKQLDLLVFGIGRADKMSAKRNMSEKDRKFLVQQGAVGESFGHYFDIDGKEVYRQDSVGITLEDFLNIPQVIGVAGGAEKAEAIISIATLRSDMTLIMDEAVVFEILKVSKI